MAIYTIHDYMLYRMLYGMLVDPSKARGHVTYLCH